MDLVLDVQRRSLHHEVRPVLLVLAAPHQLRVQIPIAALVGDTDRALLLLPHHRLKLGGGNVFAGRVLVGERCDGLSSPLFRHLLILYALSEKTTPSS